MNLTIRHRGKTRRDLQQVRDRLMSQNGTTPAYDYELLFLFARNQISNNPIILLFALVVAGLCLLWTPWIWPVTWLSTVVFAQGSAKRLARRLLEEESETVNLKAWERRFTASEFFTALLWASLCLVTGRADGFAFDVFIFTALLIIACVRTIQASPVFPAVYAASLPITFALMLTFIGSTQIPPAAMIALAITAQALFVMMARRINETAKAMLHFRAEKDILISELEEEKSKSDEGRRRAEDASLAKSRFLATMSHELRTPLNAILGFSEILQDESYGPHSTPKYKEYAADIHRSGRHLLNLINEILDLSRIEAGRYEVSETAVNLVATLEDCCYLMSLRAEAKDIELAEAFAPDTPLLWADERAVRQICLNLLSNAVKFTPPGGRITVRCFLATDGRLAFSILDTGPGIPDDEIEKIMTAFGQGSIAHRTAEDGAGLGLPIVHGLVDLHGGELKVQSRLREGTKVSVFFPASRVMPGFQKSHPPTGASAA